MIPDFKTYVGESVWADIHRRSNGSASKKEDYLDDIYNHIISKYKISYVNMADIEYKNGHIHIPLFKILPISAYATVDIEMGYVNFSTINVNTYKSSTMKQAIKPFKNELNNLYDKIIDTYSPDISEFDGMQHWVDFKINKTTKEFCEEFIDFILNTVSDSNKSILKILEKK